MKSLYEFLLEVKDARRKQGQRTPIAAFLEMIVLAEMSGNYSIRSISRFIERNDLYFRERYNLKYGTPGYTNLRKFLSKLDYKAVNEALKVWSLQFMENTDWVSIDGKAIKSTVTNKHDSEQNYLNMVSFFCNKKGIVLDTKTVENKKEHEGLAAREMISAFELEGITFTLDALHCQKKQQKPSWSQEMIMYSR